MATKMPYLCGGRRFTNAYSRYLIKGSGKR